jgi:hypothetical protein
VWRDKGRIRWGEATYIHIINILGRRLPIRTLRELLFAALKRNRPVYQVEIHIVEAEIIQRILERLLNIVRVVLVVPQLRREEDLFTGDAALPDGIADGLFGAVAVSLSAFFVVVRPRLQI